MRSSLRRVFLAGLALGTVFVTGAVLREALSAPPEAPRAATNAPAPVEEDDWSALLAAGYRRGPLSASVRIVAFMDLQCPACARYHSVLTDLRLAHREEVLVVYRHFPLAEIHPRARKAALASECSREQGLGLEFIGKALSEPSLTAQGGWGQVARAVGVTDMPAFRACLASGTHLGRVKRDRALGERLGVAGTPTVVVNGLLYPRPPSRSTLARWVESLSTGGAGGGLDPAVRPRPPPHALDGSPGRSFPLR